VELDAWLGEVTLEAPLRRLGALGAAPRLPAVVCTKAPAPKMAAAAAAVAVADFVLEAMPCEEVQKLRVKQS